MSATRFSIFTYSKESVEVRLTVIKYFNPPPRSSLPGKQGWDSFERDVPNPVTVIIFVCFFKEYFKARSKQNHWYFSTSELKID